MQTTFGFASPSSSILKTTAGQLRASSLTEPKRRERRVGGEEGDKTMILIIIFYKVKGTGKKKTPGLKNVCGMNEK